MVHQDSLVDIAIDNCFIKEIGAQLPKKARKLIDIDGRLTTSGLVNPHMHLDKALLGEDLTNETWSFDEAIKLTIDRKVNYQIEEICSRAARVIEMAAISGTTSMRAFADVDSYGGMRPLKALIQLRETYRDIIDLQVVAFPQEGIIRQPGTDELMYEAMRLGADVVGGIPWYEHDEPDAREHTDLVFKIAKEFKADVHMLVDDTDDPNSRTLEYLALATMRNSYQGRVTASHCEALSSYNDVHADRVIKLVVNSQLNIACNSHINLVLNGRKDRQPIRRGITRVKELLDHGVNVCSGQDDVCDPYYPFGRCDQLEVALFLAHTAQLTSPKEIEIVYDMVTKNAARALGLNDYGLEAGKRADIIVYDAESIPEAIRRQAIRNYVIKNGLIVAENMLVEKLVRNST